MFLRNIVIKLPPATHKGDGMNLLAATAKRGNMITAIDKQPALVLIDLQKGIAKGALAHPLEAVLRKANDLVTAFRKAGLPIVVVNVDPSGAAWTRARVEQPAQAVPAAQREEAISIVPEIHTAPGDVFITKKTWNAFFQTTLHSQLQQRNVTNIVLAGISTSVGVEGTARAASELGYNISFALDAMTDRNLDAHERSVQFIFPRIGELGTVSEILQKLEAAKDPVS